MADNDEISMSEIQQLIGRNLITFQSIEILLQDIHLQKGGKGTEKELNNKRKKIKKMSFGDLTNIKIINKLDTNIDLDNESIEIETNIINFSFGNHQYLNELLKKLKQYSLARNNLVHKFQLIFNLKDSRGKSDAKNLLEQQYILLEPFKEELKEISQALTIERKVILDFLNSEEFFEELERQLSEEY